MAEICYECFQKEENDPAFRRSDFKREYDTCEFCGEYKECLICYNFKGWLKDSLFEILGFTKPKRD